MKKVLIVGYARSGKAVSLLLNRMGYQLTITDMKEITDKSILENLGIQVFDSGHPEFLIDEKWDFVVKNPGIPYHVPFIKQLLANHQRILTEIEVASWFAKKYQFASITGTNGKTTTTMILAEMLKRQFSDSYAIGNIGIPLSELVYEKGDIDAKISLEISGFQLLGIEGFHPVVSTITNLTPDHLDYFDSLEDYYKSKTLVYRNQSADDWFIRNCDDEAVMMYCQDIPCQIINFSWQHQYDLYLEKGKVYLFKQFLFAEEDLKIVGRHNLLNAIMAAAMAVKMGVTPEQIQLAIRDFHGVEHRIEYVKEINHVKYYNDSKATNTDSTIVALKAFEKPVILLAGGTDKKTGFADLIPYLSKVKQMIVFGDTKEQLKQLKEGTIVVNNLKEAVELAHEIAVSGDIVLLSPCCASYDQYENFEARGKEFKELVAKL